MGRTGHEIVTGHTPDVTLYACFDWYDWVFYKDEKDNTKKIGRNLGPAEDFDAGDCFFILTGKATTYVTNTVIKVSDDDIRRIQILSNKWNVLRQRSSRRLAIRLRRHMISLPTTQN